MAACLAFFVILTFAYTGHQGASSFATDLSRHTEAATSGTDVSVLSGASVPLQLCFVCESHPLRMAEQLISRAAGAPVRQIRLLSLLLLLVLILEGGICLRDLFLAAGFPEETASQTYILCYLHRKDGKK